MASKRQQLRTDIVIGGKVDRSAQEIERFAQRLRNNLNSMADQITNGAQVFAALERTKGYIADIGNALTETTSLYQDFDDMMRATQGKLVSATQEEIDALEQQVRAWAETTRFGATETAKAVKEAASSGWTLAEIYEGIPGVMNMAQAAGMDLTDAMEYLGSALAGMDLEMGESSELIDQWVMTANRSRATVQDLGESMEGLGSLMKMGESSEEILTLLSAMANYGTKGAEAGTLLRNVILRLVAPTQKAADMMELLNVTEEESAELAEMDLQAASEAAEKLGLSAFDAEGKMKPLLQIVSEIRSAVSGMTEEEMYKSLYAIFPTRTIKGILNLIDTSDAEYQAMMARITGSAGYAAQIAALQEGGIGGSVRSFKSRLEELTLSLQEGMTPSMTRMIEGAAALIGKLNEIPESTWQYIGSIVSTMSVAAPAMLATAGLLKLAALLLTPQGAIVAGAGVLAGLLVGINNATEESKQRKLHEMYGELTLDTAYMTQRVDEMTGATSEQQSALAELKQSVTDAGAAYQQTAGEMLASIQQWTMTGELLTQEQKDLLYAYGDSLMANIKQGIDESELYSMNVFDMLFGNLQSESGQGVFSNLILTSAENYDALREEYVAVGEDLKRALTEAFEDGTISPEEEEAIQAQIKKLAEIQARIQKGVGDTEYYRAYYKATSVNPENIGEYMAYLEERKQGALSALDEEYASYAGMIGGVYEQEMARATNEQEREAAQKNFDAAMKELAKSETVSRNERTAQYEELAERAFISAMQSMGIGDAEQGAARILLDTADQDEIDWKSVKGDLTYGQLEEQMRKLYETNMLMDGKIAQWAETAGLERVANRIEGAFGLINQLAGMSMTEDLMNDIELANQAQKDAKVYTNAMQKELDRTPLKLNATVQTSSQTAGSSGIGSLIGKLRGMIPMYAEGGRATQPSIFGEDGAEWAIPEEHSARTASLLAQAAEASGFAPKNSVTVLYQPVVNAQDARGVSEVLRRDRDEFEKWWTERSARVEAGAF